MVKKEEKIEEKDDDDEFDEDSFKLNRQIEISTPKVRVICSTEDPDETLEYLIHKLTSIIEDFN